MALFVLTHNTVASHLNRFAAKVAHDIRDWRDECAAREVLGKLTDRELDDIGLLRSDLDRMAPAARRNCRA